MVLQYTDGSPCPDHPRSKRSLDANGLSPRKLIGHDDDKRKDDDDDDRHDGSGHQKENSKRRKSTLISVLCERDALAPKASVAFVGASPDECAYFFELRSPHACGGVSNAQQTLGPTGVFGVMSVYPLRRLSGLS